MESVKEQRNCIKICVKVGKAAAGTHNVLREAYNGGALCQTTTFEWLKRFEN
jgi:hypothetical protein